MAWGLPKRFKLLPALVCVSDLEGREDGFDKEPTTRPSALWGSWKKNLAPGNSDSELTLTLSYRSLAHSRPQSRLSHGRTENPQLHPNPTDSSTHPHTPSAHPHHIEPSNSYSPFSEHPSAHPDILSLSSQSLTEAPNFPTSSPYLSRTTSSPPHSWSSSQTPHNLGADSSYAQGAPAGRMHLSHGSKTARPPLLSSRFHFELIGSVCAFPGHSGFRRSRSTYCRLRELLGNP
ncbi:hypothetical protein CRG98_023125 [Punica granatum]|uniref:Uncharacterized protein n=1 Tax=Punica granatum TaxID=22663 RepID=A0A2I0JJR0_PUNGR|nr:hypothetical protein CRG98_023125 [Punica granatum]